MNGAAQIGPMMATAAADGIAGHRGLLLETRGGANSWQCPATPIARVPN